MTTEYPTMLKFQSILKQVAIVSLAAIGLQAQAAGLEKRTFCVFDPIGAKGPAYDSMQDYKAAALAWGVELELKAYTNENVALEDFKAKKCDAVGLTGTRARPFNKFTATIEAVGAVNDYSQMKSLIKMLAKPRAAKYMTSGNYEIAGIVPGGAIYVFVRDQKINSIEATAGKRLATLEHDQASIKVVNQIGATMVPVSIATFAPRFNNGDVDIAYAPAIAYEPFEMHKGLKKNGGIYNFNLAQMNGQLIIHKGRFPKGFAQSSREYTAKNFDKAMEQIRLAEKGIPEKYWLDLPAEKKAEYKELLRQIRIQLMADGVYDRKMLKLMLKLRCKDNPAHHECVEKLEG